MTLTLGIDVGSSAVKVAVARSGGNGDAQVPALACERYRKRDPRAVVERAVRDALGAAGAAWDDLAYAATTGEGDLAPRRHGHFFGMTAHARGALHLAPGARSVLDCGALFARAIRIDARGRVLQSRMTSQCASGTGQFVANIARYLGVPIEQVGPLSAAAGGAEPVSSICAVLAETDVINMVARGVPAPSILRGIHESVATRLTTLLRLCRAEGPVCVTGGMAADVGLIEALRRRLLAQRMDLEVVAPAGALYAGAIGAALWGAFRAARTGARAAVHGAHAAG